MTIELTRDEAKDLEDALSETIPQQQAHIRSAHRLHGDAANTVSQVARLRSLTEVLRKIQTAR